jgi:hypothetical protein
MAGSERSGPISGKQHSLVASRLASEIQKTINTGLASMKVMKQVDEVIKSNFERKIIAVLKKIDKLLNSNARSKFGNRIGLLYVKIVSLQELVKSSEEGYRLICSPKGRVKVSVIKELLKIDEEIAQFINTLNELIPLKAAVKEESLGEAEEIVEDLFSLLHRRESLLAKLKQTKG